MSWDINRVILVGRLTRDVELKFTPSGSPVGRFSIAVGGRPRTENGQQVDNTSFFNIVVWNKAAENCAKYIGQGSQVIVDGRLEQRRWTASDGTKRNNVEIIADRVEFIGSGSGSGSRKPSSELGGQGKSSNEESYYDNTDYNDTPVDPDNFYDNDEPNF